MRKSAFAGAAVIGLAVVLTACGATDDTMDDQQMESPGSSDQMDDGGSMDGGGAMGESRSGALTGDDHMVSGSVTVADGEVELTDFSADHKGLHLYLADGSDQMAVEAGIDLGELTAEAEQSFDVMGETTDYAQVVVYEPMDQTVFAAADLM